MILLENHKRLTNHVYTFCFFTYSTKFQFNLYSNQFMSLWKLWSCLKLWPSSCELMINPQPSSQFQLFRGFSDGFPFPFRFWRNHEKPGLLQPSIWLMIATRGLSCLFLYPMSQPLLPIRGELGALKKNGTSRPNYSHHSTHYLTQLYQFNPTKPTIPQRLGHGLTGLGRYRAICFGLRPGQLGGG